MTANSTPFLVVTAILDASARPAAITRSHGDAMERAYKALGAAKVAGVDLVELPIVSPSFQALKKHFQFSDDTVAMYDLFPIASHLEPESRRVGGQFLAADVLWTLDAQGLLAGVPLNVKLDLPNGWDKDPKAVHERLMQAGALDILPEGIETFKNVKASWEALATK
jgi:hypothetical protein